MALNQHYTWAQFLREHPEHKEASLKRTSKEGIKLFEAAFKKHSKEYLKERTLKIEKQSKRAVVERDELTKKVAELIKVKKWPKVKIYQERVGRKDAFIARLAKAAERVKVLQKSL